MDIGTPKPDIPTDAVPAKLTSALRIALQRLAYISSDNFQYLIIITMERADQVGLTCHFPRLAVNGFNISLYPNSSIFHLFEKTTFIHVRMFSQ